MLQSTNEDLDCPIVKTVPHSEGQLIGGSHNPVTEKKVIQFLNTPTSNSSSTSGVHVSQSPYIKSTIFFVQRNCALQALNSTAEQEINRALLQILSSNFFLPHT